MAHARHIQPLQGRAQEGEEEETTGAEWGPGSLAEALAALQVAGLSWGLSRKRLWLQL